MALGSLFDGSGGFPLAGVINGITPVWASEIEPFPIRVTKNRFPSMKHLGSVTDINGAEIEPVDIITFGSPCQDLSVAGARAGIHDGQRSNLFFEAIRIIKEMRDATADNYPRFAVWENVPGAFSSNKGADFRSVLEALCGVKEPDVSVPQPDRGGWKPAGLIVGDGYSVAWRVYDAQYWGVPQRRKRIYLIADFRSERAGEILFESESLPGNPEPGGAEGQDPSRDAPGSPGRSDSPCYCLEGNFVDRETKQNGCGWRERQSYALDTIDRHAIVCLNDQGGAVMDVSEKAACLREQEHGHQPIAVYDARGNGEGGVCPTITGDHNAYVSDYTALAVSIGNGQLHQMGMEQVARPLDCMHDQQAVVYPGVGITSPQNRSDPKPGDPAPSLTNDSRNYLVAEDKPPRKYIVRRLTPTECARLQGFPDWWCDGAEGSDTAQYKLWGNGIALPCAVDVLRRIAKEGEDA